MAKVLLELVCSVVDELGTRIGLMLQLLHCTAIDLSTTYRGVLREK